MGRLEIRRILVLLPGTALAVLGLALGLASSRIMRPACGIYYRIICISRKSRVG
jgi:hypothetical protein